MLLIAKLLTFFIAETPKSNLTVIDCPHSQCRCYAGRLLCEKNGLDFTEWFNDPEEGPNGPAKFECDEVLQEDGSVQRTCKFSEPHMNDVISQFFGDPYITLTCPMAGECLHISQVPTYKHPALPSFSTFFTALMSVIGFALVGLVFYGLVWLKKKADENSGYSPVAGDDVQTGQLRHELMMSDHVPCTIMFRDLSYMIETNINVPAFIQHNEGTAQSASSVGTLPRLNSRSTKQQLMVLENVQGVVSPGEVLAIMGGSGAGKTTFLDILARKNKSGIVSGEILVNGQFMKMEKFRSIIGYFVY